MQGKRQKSISLGPASARRFFTGAASGEQRDRQSEVEGLSQFDPFAGVERHIHRRLVLYGARKSSGEQFPSPPQRGEIHCHRMKQNAKLLGHSFHRVLQFWGALLSLAHPSQGGVNRVEESAAKARPVVPRVNMSDAARYTLEMEVVRSPAVLQLTPPFPAHTQSWAPGQESVV